MARATTSRGSSSSTKRSPLASRIRAPWPRSASDSSGPGHLRVVQGGRVELHELDVGHRRAGPQGHGDAVAGALDRVGRDREELAGPAGGQQHVAAPPPAASRPAASRATTPRHRPSATTRSRANEFSCTAATVWRTASTRARSISAPVAAPPACTTRGRLWPPSRASSSRPCSSRSNMAPRRDQLVDPARAPRRRAPAPRRGRTARRRRPACRPGAGRSSRDPRPARRPRRPGPTGWSTGPARPWSARPTRMPWVSGGAHGRRQAGHAAAQHEQVERIDVVRRRATVATDRVTGSPDRSRSRSVRPTAARPRRGSRPGCRRRRGRPRARSRRARRPRSRRR